MPVSRKSRRPFRGSKLERILTPKPYVTRVPNPNNPPSVAAPKPALKAKLVPVDQGKVSRHLPKPALAAAGVIAGGALAGGGYWGLKKVRESQQDYPS